MRLSRLRSYSSFLVAALASIASVAIDQAPARAETPRPRAPDIAAWTPAREAQLRRQLVANFAAHPLDVKSLGSSRATLDTMPVAGGPNFVLAVDSDRSLQDTDWSNGNASFGSLQLLAEDYYAVAPDNVQFIVTFTSWRIANLGAFYLPFANDVKGIGYKEDFGTELFDMTPGSPLDGMLLMNGIDAFGVGVEANWVFNQELGHRWAAFPRFLDENGKKSDALLGRALQHWSYFLDTNLSPMEGNHWHDNGDGTFTTLPTMGTPPYMPLDLYLMGLAPASEVPPLMLIVPPTPQVPDGLGGMVDRSSTPDGARSVTISGTRMDVPIDRIIAAEGPRVPSVDTSPKEFHIGFMLAVKPGQETNQGILAEMERRVEAAVSAWEAATGGRAHLIVESHGVNPQANPPGSPCPNGILECDTSTSSVCVAPAMRAPLSDGGMPEPVCASPCPADGSACPNGGCCAPALDGNSYCFTRAYCAVPDLGAAPAGGSHGCSAGGARRIPAGSAALDAFLLLALLPGKRRLLRRLRRGFSDGTEPAREETHAM